MFDKEKLLVEKAQGILSQINYMAHEVNNYMAKVILEQNREHQYYNKVEVDGKKLRVKFFLYSGKTGTTGMIEYGFREFATICSDMERMVIAFNRMAIKLMDTIDSCSTNSILGIEGEI